MRLETSWMHILKRVLIVGSVVSVLAFITIVGLYFCVRAELITDLPDPLELKAIENPNASDLFALNGELISRYYIQNRTDLREDELSQHFLDALIATEDVRFYDHSGIDYRSLGRVAVKTILLQRSSSGGGSTITQQLAKNLYPRERCKVMSTPMNKLREMAIAQRIESIYSKDEILLLYCNTVSFGELAFGLKTGARRFFDKEPAELLIEEAATLVGMLKEKH